MLTGGKWEGGAVCYVLKLHLFTQRLAPDIIKIIKYKSAQQLFCAQLSLPIQFEPGKEELVVPAQPPFPASKAPLVMLKWCAIPFSLGRVSLASFLPYIFISSDIVPNLVHLWVRVYAHYQQGCLVHLIIICTQLYN